MLVTPADGPRERFDEVVFASHADQTLKMLADPSRAEQQILSTFTDRLLDLRPPDELITRGRSLAILEIALNGQGDGGRRL